MTPYYEQDGITIYHGDCRDILPTLAAESVDLVLTDPPYGIGYESSSTTRRDGRPRKHAASFGVDQIETGWIDTAATILKRDSAMYVFTRWDVIAPGNTQLNLRDSTSFNGSYGTSVTSGRVI